jgi:8-oxo-dGTP pyrophosphatase MutT (NUDIX family)
MTKKIDAGDWGHSKYEAYLDIGSDYTKNNNKITGAVAVCITNKNEVVLSNSEPLGGHTEQGETPIDTIKREALEEGGFEISKAKYYGYYLIMQSTTADDSFKTKYPSEALILFFIARGNIVSEPIDNNAGVRAVIPVNELIKHSEIKHKMLLEGVKLYPDYLKV